MVPGTIKNMSGDGKDQTEGRSKDFKVEHNLEEDFSLHLDVNVHGALLVKFITKKSSKVSNVFPAKVYHYYISI